MKVPWPLSDREILVHYFFFEYFKDDLVVILLNTVEQTPMRVFFILPLVLMRHYSEILQLLDL